MHLILQHGISIPVHCLVYDLFDRLFEQFIPQNQQHQRVDSNTRDNKNKGVDN